MRVIRQVNLLSLSWEWGRVMWPNRTNIKESRAIRPVKTNAKEARAAHDFMYNSAVKSLEDSIVSFQKYGSINMKLASISAQYIAVNAVYKNSRECEKILKTILASKEANALLGELHREGFLVIAPKIYALLESASFDAALAHNLFPEGRGPEKYLSILKNSIVRMGLLAESKQVLPERLKVMRNLLKILESSCKSKATLLSPKDLSEYSEDDLQVLLNLISNMVPDCIKAIHAMRDNVAYEEKIKSFGAKLNSITRMNNRDSGQNDHKILLAMVAVFDEYGFSLDNKFKTEIGKNNKGFDTVKNSFLIEGRVSALLLAIDLKVQRSNIHNDELERAILIIKAINSALSVDSDNENSPLTTIPLTEEKDITDKRNKRADLFIEYFSVNKKTPKELIADILGQGLTFGKAFLQNALTAGRYFMAAVDISLILLSLAAGTHVFLANSILIISLSAITLCAFIMADCINAYYDLDSISARIYKACIDLYNLLSGKNSKSKQLVVCYDNVVIFDENLKMENQQHSGLVLSMVLEPEGMPCKSPLGVKVDGRFYSDSYQDNSVLDMHSGNNFGAEFKFPSSPQYSSSSFDAGSLSGGYYSRFRNRLDNRCFSDSDNRPSSPAGLFVSQRLSSSFDQPMPSILSTNNLHQDECGSESSNDDKSPVPDDVTNCVPGSSSVM